jgi:hypothetical protein
MKSKRELEMKPTLLTEEQIEELNEDYYNSNMTLRALLAKYKIRHSVLNSHLNRIDEEGCTIMRKDLFLLEGGYVSLAVLEHAVIKSHAKTLSASDTAEQLGVSIGRIYAILRRKGITISKADIRFELQSRIESALLSLWDRGSTTYDIASRTKMPELIVQRLLKLNGVNFKDVKVPKTFDILFSKKTPTSTFMQWAKRVETV